MTKRVLLFTSPCASKNRFWTCSITSPVGSMMPPCDLASIAAVIREHGAEAKIIDLRLESDPKQAMLDMVASWKPDATITNIATATAMDDFPILNALRNKVERIICFGFHAMALPEESFSHGATHILAGDPEFAVVEAALGEGKPQQGLWVPGNTKCEPGWIENLDTLPFPALDLIPNRSSHSLIMGNEKFAILLATRGCPFCCPYCAIPPLLGRKARAPSTKRVVDEMEHNLRNHGIRVSFFIDSALNLDQEWLRDLCNEIINRRLDLKWCGNMRTQPISQELLALMRKAGCFRVFFGVEDLDHIDELNRRTTRSLVADAFKLTRDAGIESIAFLILFPGFDSSENAMTRRILKSTLSFRPDAIQVNLAVPYPGTAMYQVYKDKFGSTDDWSLYDPAGNKLPYNSGIDLYKVRRNIYLGFYLRRPWYVIRYMWNTDASSLVMFVRNATKVLLGKYLE